MSTAEQILQTAKEKFNTGINSLVCISYTTKCTCTSNTNGKSPIDNKANCITNNDRTHSLSSISSPNAMYCAGFIANSHFSFRTAYRCPGHRDSNQSFITYPLPNDLLANKIIKASQLQQLYSNIKSEIQERLNHYFYYELEY